MDTGQPDRAGLPWRLRDFEKLLKGSFRRSSSTQSSEEGSDLFINLLRVLNCVANLNAQQFAITLAQAANGHFHRRFAHAKSLADLGVGLPAALGANDTAKFLE